MKKLLFLGGSAQQVPAIEKAKQMGIKTILIDYLPDNPGQYVSDKWHPVSTTDIEAVLRIASQEKIDGILAFASDPAALPAALVANRLGLPTNPPESVKILGEKHKFRTFLKENHFFSPENFTFSPDLPISELKDKIENNLSFPIIIKPTDSSGSKGVSILNNCDVIEDSVKHASLYSRNQILIVEEYIHRGFPDVIGGDIFVENGIITLFGEMRCLRGDSGKSLIPIGEKKPNGLNEKQRDILYKELKRLISLLHINTGELNIEVIFDKNDNPYFLEVGPRAGGNMIPIQLSDMYQVDLIEANILAALGEPVNLKPKDPHNAFMTFVLHSHKEGIFESVFFHPKVEKYIYRKVLYKKQGEKVEKFDGAGKALGIVFMKFPDALTMNRVQSELENLIIIKLENNNSQQKFNTLITSILPPPQIRWIDSEFQRNRYFKPTFAA